MEVTKKFDKSAIQNTLMMNLASEMFVEQLENFQKSKRFIAEAGSTRLNLCPVTFSLVRLQRYL
jgi:hypothetical protein